MSSSVPPREYPLPVTRHASSAMPTPLGAIMLQQWLERSLISAEDWEQLPADVQDQLRACCHLDQLVEQLAAHRLLTEYQAMRVQAGALFGLVLGNYRVLDRLGSGAMGAVYKAEHIIMRRLAAIKVISLLANEDAGVLRRFRAEIRAISQLRHPNIISVYDAGHIAHPQSDSPDLHYFVMEYLPGRDLDHWVRSDGPLAIDQACDVIYQVASALVETHKHNLVHRDIKPSNILVTPERQAKLLDFGLARHLQHRLTEPGVVLGTLDYMAPEQAMDASRVDIRTDIYGLGGTLFWCLARRSPFNLQGSMTAEVVQRMTQAAPSVRVHRPDVPVELDHILARMMALRPDDRYQTPQAVMNALLPFLQPDRREQFLGQRGSLSLISGEETQPTGGSRAWNLLVVDDEDHIRQLCVATLSADDRHCDAASSGQQALTLLTHKPYDLVLLDINLPDIPGLRILRQLRHNPPAPFLKVIMISGTVNADEMARLLSAGADDYLIKPFSLAQLLERVRSALRLKELQEKSAALNQQLRVLTAQQERQLHATDTNLVKARQALVSVLTRIMGQRFRLLQDTSLSLARVCRCLAAEAARLPHYAAHIDEAFIRTLESCVPLHDLGMVVLPDHILFNSEKLTDEDRLIMQTHTTLGAEILTEAIRSHDFDSAFLQMASQVIRHHHERWDGTGYPDRLAGEAIPLSARITTLADVYVALRFRRPHRPALAHEPTVQLVIHGEGHFDPLLLQAFQRVADRLDQLL